MRFIFFVLFILICETPAHAVYRLKPKDIALSDFEAAVNRFGGSQGTYGAVKGSGYTSSVFYTGSRSYRLVFSKNTIWSPEDDIQYDKSTKGLRRTGNTLSMAKPKIIDWAVFTMDMGCVIDSKAKPAKIEALDISGFRYLVFWIKGKRGGERFRVYIRDAHALSYDPQVKLRPHIVVSKEWKPVKVSINRLRGRVDVKNIVQIGIGFGREDENRPGNVMYIDNFILVK